jgi:small subunit ribosomal protein S9
MVRTLFAKLSAGAMMIVKAENADAARKLVATDTLGRYDVKANVDGGGNTGQAGALRLAVARALVKIDEAHRRKLRDLGLLTRDARAVERKKPGRPKARKRVQFSKR